MIRSGSVLLLGLTGGIGSGKSTVSGLLSRRGAVVIDADRITREVQAPGGAAYQGIVDRFGSGILAVDGAIDRPALAKIVFNDADALRELNALTHPHVGQVMSERMAAEAETDHVVVLDIPLLVESSRSHPGMAGVIVVDNSGSMDQLAADVDRCWAWIQGLAAAAPAVPQNRD